MAATALIQFTQGANTDAAGKAVLGDYGDFSAVTVTNGDNTDVASWVIYLLDAPPDSVTFPPASQPQILAQAVDNTPTVAFTPDVAGTYRVMLEVTDAFAVVDRDIRCFAIPDERGFVRPPYQLNPEPLPIELPVIITRGPRPFKPDEQNYGTNVRGWAGNGTANQLDAFLRQHGDLPFQIVAVTPFTATDLDPPLHLVDSDTIGGAATFNLPLTPRTGFVARIAVLGSPGSLVTIEAQGGGTVGDGSPLELRGGKGVFLVHQGSNNWVILTGVPKDVSLLSTVMYVDFGYSGPSPDGTILNPYPTILDAVNAGSDGVIYLTVGNYTAEVLNFTATPLELIALAGSPIYGFWLPTITTDSFLSLTNIGASVGAIVSTHTVYLNNCRIDGAITGLSLVAHAFPDINNLCLLGGAILCDASVVINGYTVSSTVTSTGGNVRLTDSVIVGSITGNTVYAQNCTLQGAALSVAGLTSKLVDCSFGTSTVITFTGAPGVLTVDGATYSSMQSAGVTVVNGTIDALLGLTKLDLVWYADSETTVVGGDGNIERPFVSLVDAIAAVEAEPSSSFKTLLCQGSFTEDVTFSEDLKIASVAPNQHFTWDGDVIITGGITLSVWGARIEDIANTIDVDNAGGTLLADRCEFMVITGSGSAVLTDTTATDITLNTVVLNGCTVSGAVTLGVGDTTWKDSTIGDAVVITTGNLSADRCSFGFDITVTAGDLRLTNSTVGSLSTITCGGFLLVDAITYERFIIDSVVVTAAGGIHILGVATPQQVIGWDTVAPQVLTVLPIGHPAGVYLIAGTAIVTDDAATGDLERTVAWTAPTLGADTNVVGSIPATTTGSKFLDPVTIVSTGAAAVTVTFASSTITGTTVVDLYASATLLASSS